MKNLKAIVDGKVVMNDAALKGAFKDIKDALCNNNQCCVPFVEPSLRFGATVTRFNDGSVDIRVGDYIISHDNPPTWMYWRPAKEASFGFITSYARGLELLAEVPEPPEYRRSHFGITVDGSVDKSKRIRPSELTYNGMIATFMNDSADTNYIIRLHNKIWLFTLSGHWSEYTHDADVWYCMGPETVVTMGLKV